jgi:hypothetical protein
MLLWIAGRNATPAMLCLPACSGAAGHRPAASRRRLWKRYPAVFGMHQRTTAEFTHRRARPLDKILIAQPLLPAVSFPGGFQTPAGTAETWAHPSGRHLKPITGADFRQISKNDRL